MKIKIYQINLDRDENGVAFEGFERLQSVQGSEKINSTIYDVVFDGNVDCNNLEDVYQMFNIDIPKDYQGRSFSVSDVAEIAESDNVEPGFYYCDSVGFKKVDFNSDAAGILRETKKIKVVLCEPGKIAKITEIGSSLKELQAAVEGDIEAFYPFEEPVCIVCNDEGKFNGSLPNRAVYGEDEKMIDIIFGPFFICDCSGESFDSLDEEKLKKYSEQFKFPERFIRVNGEIQGMKYKPVK